jgi:ABC-type phosphate/phosphonate transport system substrate-binding protein
MLCRISRPRVSSRGTVLVGLVLLVSWCGSGRAAGPDPKQPKTLRVGLVNSLFRNYPEWLVQASLPTFRSLVASQTGLDGELIAGGDPDQIGEALTRNQMHLAIFHGFEFAWVRQKYPDLLPLVIIVNQERQLFAHVLVRQDSRATRLADICGRTLALPRTSQEHCRLFLERQCQTGDDPWQRFFSQVTAPANIEDALDDVVDGVVQATVVDGVGLRCYQRRKPGRFAKLKELHKSERFPPAVVAYHAGALDEAALRSFREGMIHANEQPLGRQVLTLWHITGFERVPDDYEQDLAAIAKAYPCLQLVELHPPKRAGKLTRLTTR